LSPRDRSLITVASLVSLYRMNELPFHLKNALENGVTRNDLIELITHLALYSGWSTANTALPIARQVFDETATRLPRVSRLQAMSGINKTRFHLPDGPAQQQRDAATAGGSTDWSLAAVTWLSEHDAAVVDVPAEPASAAPVVKRSAGN
jgi:hypothetical protein